jgi:hypothetical protein
MCKVHDCHPALTDHVDQPVAAGEYALGQYHRVIGPGRASQRVRRGRDRRDGPVTVRPLAGPLTTLNTRLSGD